MPLGWASRVTRRSTNQERSKGNPGRFPGKLLGDQPAQAAETAFCQSACDLLSALCELSPCFVSAAGLRASLQHAQAVWGEGDASSPCLRAQHSSSRNGCWALMGTRG